MSGAEDSHVTLKSVLILIHTGEELAHISLVIISEIFESNKIPLQKTGI